MNSNVKQSEINSANIAGSKTKQIPKFYIAENALSEQKTVEPVSITMQNFVKNEFSKIKAKY